MVGREALLDVVQHVFLVNVDQHVAMKGFRQAGVFDLPRLEDGIAVAQDYRRSPVAHVSDSVD
jgi:hypothetical protein